MLKIKIVLILVPLFCVAALSAQTNIANALSVPSLKVEPIEIDFGLQAVGSSSAAKTVTISNEPDSTNVLTIYNIYIDGPDISSYSIIDDHCSGRILDGSMSSTLGIVFHPDSAGTKEAKLIIPTNAWDKSFEVPLIGTTIFTVEPTTTPTSTVTITTTQTAIVTTKPITITIPTTITTTFTAEPTTTPTTATIKSTVTHTINLQTTTIPTSEGSQVNIWLPVVSALGAIIIMTVGFVFYISKKRINE